jgi:alanine racemase
VLLGQQGDEFISANELAERLDTITYEIFTMIATRVARVVVS